MDVFISYAREDADLAEPLKVSLQKLGLSCFFDLDDGIHSGDAFPQRIADAVRESKAVVACWTPYALTRTWCRRESFIAQELGKLVPLALKPLQPSDRVEFIDVSFEDLTDYDFKGPHSGWSQTLRSLAAKLDAWAEGNPEKPVADVLARAASLRAEAIRLKPLSKEPSSPRLVGVEAVWSAVDKDDPVELVNFAESFTGSPRAFEARQRIRELNRMAAAFAILDFDSHQSLDTFLAAHPLHPRRAQVQLRRDELEAQELETCRQAIAKALAERAEKEKGELALAERRVQAFKRQAEIEARWGWALKPIRLLVENADNLMGWLIVILVGTDLLPGDLPFLLPLTEIDQQMHAAEATGVWGWVLSWVLLPALFLLTGTFVNDGAWLWVLAYILGAILIARNQMHGPIWEKFWSSLLSALVIASCIIHFSPLFAREIAANLGLPR